MIKIAICDLEKKDRELTCGLVQTYMDRVGEAYTLQLFSSGQQFLDSGFVPDIIFLDSVLPDKSGMEVGIELRRLSRNVMIIYTTHAAGETRLVLNRIHVFGVLVKPIMDEKLFLMMKDALFHMGKEQYRDLGENIEVFFSEDGTILRLDAMDIIYFEYRNRRVRIVTQDQSFICKEKIGDIAERMKKYGFAMSHQSFVVNLYHVAKMERTVLTMKNGDQVDLAQKRASTVRKQLMIKLGKQTTQEIRNERL